MIAERLDAGKILFGLQGDLADVIDQLTLLSSLPNLTTEFHWQKANHALERFSYLGEGIAVPHIRLANLAAPELILGLSASGLALNQYKVHVVLLLASPEEQTAEHLQLLQRIGAVFPAIRDRMIQQRDGDAVLRLVAQAEQAARLPSYINLTQEQIAFELQTDLERGLSTAEAESRLSHYGENRLHRVRVTP